MPLNGILLNAGTGGLTLASDRVGGFDYQVVKIAHGVDDSTPVSVSSANPLPVTNDAAFTDDAAFTLASSKVMVGGAIRDDTLSALAAAEGDAVPLRVNSTGALHVTGGGGTEYNEDDATPATIVGDAVLLERDDALSTVTPVEGDWIGMRGTAEGALWTQDFNSDAILTSVQLIDDAVYTDDTSTHATGTSKGLLVMAAATPTDGSVDANDIGAVAMSLDRRLHVDAQIVGTDAALDVSAATVTVSASGTFSNQHTAKDLDYDTGAGTDTISAFGIVLPASGGAVAGGTSTDPIRIDPTGTTTQPVSDAGGSLTVDNAALSQTGGGVEASALRVTLASDSTGLVSVDDNGGSLTVDGTVAVSSISTSITPGTAAANLGKAEDAVHATGDTGVMALGVRKATPVNLSSLDGDYEPFQVSAGRLWTSATIDAALPAGTNAIGKLAANSGVDIGDVDVLSQPARAATTDTITAKLATDAIQNGTTALTPKFVAFSAASSGDNAIIAAVASKKLRVLALALNAFGDVNAEFQDNATATTRSGLFDLGTSSGKAKGLVLGFSPVGHFETASGVGLDLNLSAAITVEGHLVYVEV